MSHLLGVEQLAVVSERLELDVDGGLVLHVPHRLQLDVGLSWARREPWRGATLSLQSPFPCSVLILFIYSYFDGANNKIWQVCAPARSRHLRRRESAASVCRQGSGRTFPPCNNTHYRYYLDIHISSSRYLDISTLQTMWICVSVNVYCWSYV